MELNHIGQTDLCVSRVGLGCNNFGVEALGNLDLRRTRDVVDAALDVGINFLDTANTYGHGASERMLGEILEGRRDRVVLATKFGNPMPGIAEADGGARGTRSYIRRAIQGQLERLRTDYIDLYYYHQPDGVTPLVETLEALDELVREGTVRYLGCSNFTAALLKEGERISADRHAARFVAVQNRFNLLERGSEDEVLAFCRRHDIGFVPYFPLASGLLTGKYRRREKPSNDARLARRPEALTEQAFDRVARFEEFAAEQGHSLLELAIAGVASEPAIVSVIAGATRPEQAVANARAAEWHLTDQQLDELRRLSSPTGTR